MCLSLKERNFQNEILSSILRSKLRAIAKTTILMKMFQRNETKLFFFAFEQELMNQGRWVASLQMTLFAILLFVLIFLSIKMFKGGRDFAEAQTN